MDRLLLAGQADTIATICDWAVPKLPVSGGDIVAQGVTAGPDVARLLRAVEDEWVATGFPDRTATLGFMQSLIATESDG